MTQSLTIALAQVNPTVGNIAHNAALIKRIAQATVADVVVFPELTLSGYPPEDLVLLPSFLDTIMTTLTQLAQQLVSAPAVLVGTPWRQDGKVYNAVALLQGGQVRGVIAKHALPNYGVFDEARVFTAGDYGQPVTVKGIKLGILICEDTWYAAGAKALLERGAEILISVNASPYEVNKATQRVDIAASRSRETSLPLIYLNMIGGQDELVFDGRSFVLNANGQPVGSLPPWRENVTVTQWRKAGNSWVCQALPASPALGMDADVYAALVMGLRDYVQKNRFKGVVLGLSGGIDSALCAAIAMDALGKDNVMAVMMPSPYTSQMSLDDAKAIAQYLGIRLDTVPIAHAMEHFASTLAAPFRSQPAGVTAENLQSRLRGMTLMAYSNHFGHMVLSTGNKSEMAVGYATLYGDMCGGFAVLKDVYKTLVFRLARWRNTQGMVMPERVITRPPSAELRPDQKDEDSLPPYATLDGILFRLIEQQKSVAEVARDGFDTGVVQRVAQMLTAAEYKRRQAPPGVKITARAFGRERRMPITSGWMV